MWSDRRKRSFAHAPNDKMGAFLRAIVLLLAAVLSFAGSAYAADRPNILWITSEDNGPHLGCYGDAYAMTPHLDALAARGMIYRRAWSNWPVCAPARTALITGMYPSSTGSENMRSLVQLPASMRFFPELLRDAGYYCTNNAKEDYNLVDPGQAWDESSPRAHWRNRAAGQPFFAVFNAEISHESQLRAKRPLVHDPTKVRVPPYHPDTPEVREDWARYYDNLTLMDERLGAVLREVEDAGLFEDTIVFYFGDHGSGMPRHKRAAQDSGLRVPLIVYVPERFQNLAPADYAAGGASDRLVSFVDFGPTVLSLAGVRAPDYMQGHAFAGSFAQPERQHLFGARGRMDARIDLVRTVTDGRFVYVRNYMPHLPHGQHLAYQMETATTRVWYELYTEGKLNSAQAYFWGPKAPEELYDLDADPDETMNLADDEASRATLSRLSDALDAHLHEIRDVGFVPEPELRALRDGDTPYDFGHDEERYPLDRVLETARMAASMRPDYEDDLAFRTRDLDATVRYWAALGLYMRGADAGTPRLDVFRPLLTDASPVIRIVAAQALARYGERDDAAAGMEIILRYADASRNEAILAAYALNALDYLDGTALPYIERIRALPTENLTAPQRYRSYVPRILEKTLADLE